MNDVDAAELLEGLVRIPSPSGQEARAATWLVARMRELGFDAECDEAGNAVGRLGDHGPRLALVGHIDTVPGDIPVRVEDGRLYGRGSVDAKGCLAAFVVAVARASASGRLRSRVEIVGCVEEEVSSSKGAHYRATLPAPDALIIGEPSGAHSVTTGYKGFLAANLRWREGLAHTAGPEVGAAARACRHFVDLECETALWNTGKDALYESLSLHLSDVRTSTDGRYVESELELRLRLPEALSPERALSWLEERSDGWRISAAGGLPAWCGPRSSPLARHLGRAIARRGARARYVRKTGTADLNVLAPAWNCQAVAYGPGDSALDHSPDEHLLVSEFFEGVTVLQDLLESEAAALEFRNRSQAIGV